MSFDCPRYQSSRPPSHTHHNLYTEELHTEISTLWRRGRKKYMFLLSSSEWSFSETLTLPSSSPWFTSQEHLRPSFIHSKGGGEQQGADCCWSEMLREAWVGSAGHRSPFIGLRYSWHIWSYVVFTVSLLSDQVKEKLLEGVNNKLFDLRALLPISAFSLYCKITQNKGVITLCTLLQKGTIHFRKASGRKVLD